MSRPRPAPRINPSGRPLERPGWEAAVAGAIILCWMVAMGSVLGLTAQLDLRDSGAPSLGLALIAALCWLGAERAAGGERHLVWPASAFGIVGPISLGYAAAMMTPELREAPFALRMAVIATVSGLAMIPFLFRFRLPGLVSPIITFALVGLFLGLYGTDMERLKEVEGFSARGILAALVANPWFASVFGVLAAGALVLARRLDLHSDNFGLAAARPLHLVGAGVVALVAGRIAATLPGPADLLALAALWLLAVAWTMRVNRVAVMLAAHFAMAKPAILAVTGRLGVELDLAGWTWVLTAIVLADLAVWPALHRHSRRLDWTLGPGGVKPPLDGPGFWWRYWPYSTEESVARWARQKAERRARRRAG